MDRCVMAFVRHKREGTEVTLLNLINSAGANVQRKDILTAPKRADHSSEFYREGGQRVEPL